jgi:hypothetical protein
MAGIKSTMPPAEVSVRRLAAERPDWLPVLDAAVAVAGRVETHGGEFAGAWVLDELGRRSEGRWVPNLRLLVSYGLIEKSGASTRGGKRAYYRMTNREDIENALRRLRGGATATRSLRFVGAGKSGRGRHKTARTSSDAAYEPRSWR